MPRSFRKSKHLAAAMTDNERESLCQFAHEDAMKQWGKPLPSRAIELLRLYTKRRQDDANSKATMRYEKEAA